jgi:hypothetical protein
VHRSRFPHEIGSNIHQNYCSRSELLFALSVLISSIRSTKYYIDSVSAHHVTRTLGIRLVAATNTSEREELPPLGGCINARTTFILAFKKL